MLNKVKKIGGYPSPFVTVEEKSKKEYGLEYLKKMYSEWIAEGRTPESFLKTFITRRPPAPAPPHGTMAGTHGM